MRICSPMTYFLPYVSGPIVHADIVGRELVERGHEVTFLTTQHERHLPRDETLPSGVDLCRVPVVGAVSRGVLAPGFLLEARRQFRAADAVWVHVPQLEAPALVALARLMGKPVVSTCHTDLVLPPGRGNELITGSLRLGHRVAFAMSQAVTSYTRGYAEYSPLLRRHLDRIEVIAPPIEVDVPPPEQFAAFRERLGVGNRPVVGICARLAAEKGFEQVLAILPRLLDHHPDLVVVHAGETDAVPGERSYRERMDAMIAPWSDHWVTAGVLRGSDLGSFYATCELVVLPSVNTTESFGLVQVEAMLAGTPLVTSSLPGVREPIERTRMGVLVDPGDTDGLLAGCLAVLADPAAHTVPRADIEAAYGLRATIDDYERLFRRLAA